MKLSAIISFLVLTSGAFAQNYSDDYDKNAVPSTVESRENELGNKIDSVDANTTPAPLEEREQREEMESDLIQKDDPEKMYDARDEETDE